MSSKRKRKDRPNADLERLGIGFQPSGKMEFPLLVRQEVDLSNVSLIRYSNVKKNDSEENRGKGVHFFEDDDRFANVVQNPAKALKKLSQYKFLLTPDCSLYADMPVYQLIKNVGLSRLCGAIWQKYGAIVIPTVCWAKNDSFSFCFDGIERGCVVAVGMIGCKRNNRRSFMFGYDSMLKALDPEAILCYGAPFPEMKGTIIRVEYSRGNQPRDHSSARSIRRHKEVKKRRA